MEKLRWSESIKAIDDWQINKIDDKDIKMIKNR